MRTQSRTSFCTTSLRVRKAIKVLLNRFTTILSVVGTWVSFMGGVVMSYEAAGESGIGVNGRSALLDVSKSNGIGLVLVIENRGNFIDIVWMKFMRRQNTDPAFFV